MSSFKKIKKASKYADCKNSGKGSLLKYYGVKTERREKSTMLLYSEMKKSEETLEDIGLNTGEYSCMGGGFPIRIEEVGVIGVILVSNQNHFVNHDIIVRAVSRYLHVDEVPRIRAL